MFEYRSLALLSRSCGQLHCLMKCLFCANSFLNFNVIFLSPQVFAFDIDWWRHVCWIYGHYFVR
jgi:hypothetical protein